MKTLTRLIAMCIFIALLYYLNVDSFLNWFITEATFRIMQALISIVSLIWIMTIAKDRSLFTD